MSLPDLHKSIKFTRKENKNKNKDFSPVASILASSSLEVTETMYTTMSFASHVMVNMSHYNAFFSKDTNQEKSIR